MAPEGVSAVQQKAAGAAQPPARRYVVRVRQLVLRMLIGVHAHERLAPQRVRVSLTLGLIPPEDGFNDEYRKVVCYETLIGRIKDCAAEGHFILVETFAERIAAMALADPRVEWVRVEVDKPDIFDDAEAVGALIEMTRPEA